MRHNDPLVPTTQARQRCRSLGFEGMGLEHEKLRSLPLAFVCGWLGPACDALMRPSRSEVNTPVVAPHNHSATWVGLRCRISPLDAPRDFASASNSRFVISLLGFGCEASNRPTGEL